MIPTLLDESRLVSRGEVSTRRHEEGAAAHRGVDNSQSEDAIGRRAAHERTDRASDEVFGDRLRCVERAGSLPDAGSGLERDGLARIARPRGDARLVVEQRFVHGAELLDAEIPIGDALAAGAIRRRPCRQRQHGAARSVIVEVAPIGEWRPRRREQAAIEGRHAEVACAAAGVRQPVDGADRVPEAGCASRAFRRRAQRFDAVALAINRMPQRHQASCFGKEQK